MNNKKFIWWLLILAMLTVVIFFSGCSLLQKAPSDEAVMIELTPVQQVQKMVQGTNWLVTLSILGVGAGFFSFLNGGSRGIQIMAACMVVLSLVLGVARYSTWIALIAVAGAVALLAYTILVRVKATKEIIAGVQLVKNYALSEPHPNRSTMNAKLEVTQSATTKEIVKDVKNNLSK